MAKPDPVARAFALIAEWDKKVPTLADYDALVEKIRALAEETDAPLMQMCAEPLVDVRARVRA